MKNRLKSIMGIIVLGIVGSITYSFFEPVVSSVNPLDEYFPSNAEKILKKIEQIVEEEKEIFEQERIDEQLDRNHKITVDLALLEKLESLDKEKNQLKQELEQMGQKLELSIEVMLMRSNFYFYAGQYDLSLNTLDSLLVVDPNHTDAWNNRGIVLDFLYRYEEAFESYDKAIELNPNDPSIWNNRGWSLGQTGNFTGAISSFEKTIELAPQDPRGWYGKGVTLMSLNRYSEAIVSFDKAIEIDPNFIHAWNAKGNSLKNLNRYEEAISSYDKALEIDPENEMIKRHKKMTLELLESSKNN